VKGKEKKESSLCEGEILVEFISNFLEMLTQSGLEISFMKEKDSSRK